MHNERSPICPPSPRIDNSIGKVSNDDNSSNPKNSNNFDHGEVQKNIGFLGSFVLIANNTTGPAMMAIPQVFQQAGVIPTLVCIALVCVCSSVTTTMMSDTIASIPGNSDFDKPITFASAFRVIVGPKWHRLAECLFLSSCFVQISASLVETAQSLDGFLASFLLGRTWGLQILPFPNVVEWSPSLSSCGDEDCTPFKESGSLVLTLGFVVTTIIFISFGWGHLHETIVIQLISFICFFVLLSQFMAEFVDRGFTYSIPMWGDNCEQLAGVILFNFAFSITVPSWLNEKKSDVSVNKIVWGSSLFSSAIYVVFGIAGAMSFKNAPSNILVSLSSKQVHLLTRICAAVFGITIIGSGVPVFCIIIKCTLYNSGDLSAGAALFCGAVLPYLLSWTLYQGTMLINLLNWAGLVINGLVAFILPLVLTLRAIKRTRADRKMKLIKGEYGSLVDTRGKSNDSVNDCVNGNEDGVIVYTPFTFNSNADPLTFTTHAAAAGTSTLASSSSLRPSSMKSDSDSAVISDDSIYYHAIAPLPLPDDDEDDDIPPSPSLSLACAEGEGLDYHYQLPKFLPNQVQPLPSWITMQQKVFLIWSIITVFTLIVVSTISVDLRDGISPAEDLDP